VARQAWFDNRPNLDLNEAASTDAAGNTVSLDPAVLNLQGTPQSRPAYHPFRALVAGNSNLVAILTATASVCTDIPGTYGNLGTGSILSDGITYQVTGTAEAVNAALHSVLLMPAPTQSWQVSQVNGLLRRIHCHSLSPPTFPSASTRPA
jgi:hypothetical protein